MYRAGFSPDWAPDCRFGVVNKRLNVISDEFWQLLAFTGATSLGSAKVISTHYSILLIDEYIA